MMHTIVGQNKVSPVDFIADSAPLMISSGMWSSDISAAERNNATEDGSSTADSGDLVVSEIAFDNPLLVISTNFVSRDFSNDDAKQKPAHWSASRIESNDPLSQPNKSSNAETDSLETLTPSQDLMTLPSSE
jgi:hypothetical protein